jgi:membrane associated rhomboid family serine protease
MLYHDQSEDYRPLFWMQGRPIYVTTFLVSAHVAAFVISALCISYFGLGAVYDGLALSTPEIWHKGQVWRLFSYIAFDPAFFSERSLWFLINIALFYFFGREVEQFIGRKIYFKLYAALVLVPAILLCLLGLVIVPTPFLNCCEVFFGVFVAFATIYPGVMPSSWIPLTASTLVWILLGISSLIHIAFHDFTSLFMLWTSSAVGYFGMCLAGAGCGMAWLTDWMEERRAQKLIRQHNFKIVKDKQATESIDAILDKISKQGVGSLDAQERAALERARTKLLQRDER